MGVAGLQGCRGMGVWGSGAGECGGVVVTPHGADINNNNKGGDERKVRGLGSDEICCIV